MSFWLMTAGEHCMLTGDRNKTGTGYERVQANERTSDRTRVVNKSQMVEACASIPGTLLKTWLIPRHPHSPTPPFPDTPHQHIADNVET